MELNNENLIVTELVRLCNKITEDDTVTLTFNKNKENLLTSIDNLFKLGRENPDKCAEYSDKISMSLIGLNGWSKGLAEQIESMKHRLEESLCDLPDGTQKEEVKNVLSKMNDELVKLKNNYETLNNIVKELVEYKKSINDN